jgi:hypothetical protein
MAVANKEKEKKEKEEDEGGLPWHEPCWWYDESNMHTVTRQRRADIQVG